MAKRRCLGGCGRKIPASETRCARCSRDRHQARAATDPYQDPRWAKLSRACVRRDGACTVCDSTRRLTAHHIVPRRKSGLLVPLEELMTLCGSCHSQYEADVRAGKWTAHRQLVEAIGAALLATARGGGPARTAAYE